MGRYVVLLQGKAVFLNVSPSGIKNIQRGASNSKNQESYEDFKRGTFFPNFSGETGGGIADELLT